MVSCTPTLDLPSPRHPASQGESGHLGFAASPQGRAFDRAGFPDGARAGLVHEVCKGLPGREDQFGVGTGRKQAGRGEKRLHGSAEISEGEAGDGEAGDGAPPAGRAFWWRENSGPCTYLPRPRCDLSALPLPSPSLCLLPPSALVPTILSQPCPSSLACPLRLGISVSRVRNVQRPVGERWEEATLALSWLLGVESGSLSPSSEQGGSVHPAGLATRLHEGLTVLPVTFAGGPGVRSARPAFLMGTGTPVAGT